MTKVNINLAQLSGVESLTENLSGDFWINFATCYQYEVSSGEWLTQRETELSVESGVAVMYLPPTPTGNPIKIRERGWHGARKGYVLVPDQEEIDYSDLVWVNGELNPIDLPFQWAVDLDQEIADREARDFELQDSIDTLIPTLVEVVNETITVGAANTTSDSRYGANHFVDIRTYTAGKTGTIYIKPAENPNDAHDPNSADLYVYAGGEAPPINAPDMGDHDALSDIYLYKGNTNHSYHIEPGHTYHSDVYAGVVGIPFEVVEGQTYDIVFWCYNPVAFEGVAWRIFNIAQQFESLENTLFSEEQYVVDGTTGKFMPAVTSAALNRIGYLPPGGATGQALLKFDGDDQDADWEDVVLPPTIIPFVADSVTVGAANADISSFWGEGGWLKRYDFTADRTGTIYVPVMRNPNVEGFSYGCEIDIWNLADVPPNGPGADPDAGSKIIRWISMAQDNALGFYGSNVDPTSRGTVRPDEGAPLDVVEGQTYSVVLWCYDAATYEGTVADVSNLSQRFATDPPGALIEGMKYDAIPSSSGMEFHFALEKAQSKNAVLDALSEAPVTDTTTGIVGRDFVGNDFRVIPLTDFAGVLTTIGPPWALVPQQSPYFSGGQMYLEAGMTIRFNNANATGLRLAKRVTPVTTAALATFNWDTMDQLNHLAQHTAVTIALAGTPTPGQQMMLRIKDDGTARAITYPASFRAGNGVTLATSTTPGKTLYTGGVWNETDGKVDILAQQLQA